MRVIHLVSNKKIDNVVLNLVKKTNKVVSTVANMKSGCDSYSTLETRESGTTIERFFSKNKLIGKYVQQQNGDTFRNHVDGNGIISHIEIFYADANRIFNIRREPLTKKLVTTFASGLWG